MQKDFHYYLIRALAEHAGFTAAEAQVIAYASQYVDDAVEHKQLLIEGLPPIEYPRLKADTLFDPVCTAHRGIQYFLGFQKDVQRKIYIPFHFLPSHPYGGAGKYSYVTEPDSPLAQSLLLSAIESVRSERSDRALIRFGIALHSYADTFAHQGFSGRHSPRDNDIGGIAIWKKNTYESIPLATRIKGNIFPDIGHAEALDYPDIPYLRWRFEYAHKDGAVDRHNQKIFMEAAERCYSYLCAAAESDRAAWDTVKAKCNEALSFRSESLTKRCRKVASLFPGIAFSYDDEDWRWQALRGDSVCWSEFDKDDYSSITYEFNGDLKWLYFHSEAYSQRTTLQKLIKHNLL